MSEEIATSGLQSEKATTVRTPMMAKQVRVDPVHSIMHTAVESESSANAPTQDCTELAPDLDIVQDPLPSAASNRPNSARSYALLNSPLSTTDPNPTRTCPPVSTAVMAQTKIQMLQAKLFCGQGSETSSKSSPVKMNEVPDSAWIKKDNDAQSKAQVSAAHQRLLRLKAASTKRGIFHGASPMPTWFTKDNAKDSEKMTNASKPLSKTTIGNDRNAMNDRNMTKKITVDVIEAKTTGEVLGQPDTALDVRFVAQDQKTTKGDPSLEALTNATASSHGKIGKVTDRKSATEVQPLTLTSFPPIPQKKGRLGFLKSAVAALRGVTSSKKPKEKAGSVNDTLQKPATTESRDVVSEKPELKMSKSKTPGLRKTKSKKTQSRDRNSKGTKASTSAAEADTLSRSNVFRSILTHLSEGYVAASGDSKSEMMEAILIIGENPMMGSGW